MTCTWKGCSAPAAHDRVDKSGKVWARLCEAHHHESEEAIERGDVKAMMRSWVLAAGGAEVMAQRMAPAAAAGQRLVDALTRPGARRMDAGAVLRGAIKRLEGKP